MSRPCPFCGTSTPDEPEQASRNPRYQCPVCGTYRLEERTALQLYMTVGYDQAHLHLLPNHYLVSARIRERFERDQREVYIPSLESLNATAEPLLDPLDAIDRIVLYVGAKSPTAGERLVLDSSRDYPIAYARNAQEFSYFVEKAVEMGLLESHHDRVRLSIQGWRRVKDLRSTQLDVNRAFVAMQFNSDLQSAYLEGIEPALRGTGYQPVRVDLIQHNDRIDDRIIAEIRKCGLLVADFTGQKQNVYFEAGFALGLGRNVIWTCRRGEVTRLHFDTRQYNHVLWDEPADLRENLQARIEATLPRRTS